MSEAIKLSDFPLQTSLADTDSIILDGHRITAASFLAAVRSSIKVGGRNLMKNTKGGHGPVESSATDYGWWQLTESCIVGQTYTISFECDEDVSGIALDLRYSTFSYFQYAVRKAGINRYFATGVWRQQNASAFTLGFWAGNKTLKNIKLERGNIPTDWSPAPEDLLSGLGGGKTLRVNNLRLRAERRAA